VILDVFSRYVVGWMNPWTTHSQFIVSHSLLRDEQYASPLRDWLNQHRSGSMLVLDEAHHAAPATSSSYAIDSQFTRGMRELTPLFEHRLFLSATPHNGHPNPRAQDRNHPPRTRQPVTRARTAD